MEIYDILILFHISKINFTTWFLIDDFNKSELKLNVMIQR